MEALRKGWYLGEKSFKDKLLAMLDRSGNAVSGKVRHPSVAWFPLGGKTRIGWKK
jgi:hypothetical protein